MKGLIKYDLMQICGGVKGSFVLLYVIVLAICNLFSNDGNMFSYILLFVFSMFGISAYTYEETYHWDRYTAALPLSNRQIVLARYGMVGIFLAVGVVACLLLGLISVVAGTMELSLADWVLSLVQCMAVAVLYIDIMFPVLYRFGADRGRVIMLLLFLLFFSAVCTLGAFADVWTYMITVYSVTLVLIVAAIVLLPVSIAVSVRIRAKKEF